MKYKKLFGGNQNNIQIEKFLAIVIIGYFGIKIIYGSFFNFYPEKYYQRNINISTNERHIQSEDSNTETITLNAYMPGMWNNEITDFITLLVLSFIIYVFTNFSNKSFIDINGNLSLLFLIGYIIGLGYPPIKTSYLNLLKRGAESTGGTNNTSSLSTMGYVILFAFAIFIIILNYTSIDKSDVRGEINYTTYIVVLVLLLAGLLLTRKKSNTYSTVSYSYNNGESCAFRQDREKEIEKENKSGVLETSGDKIKITVPFVVFIILLLFSNEPKEGSMKLLFMFIYGSLLGCLVSSISYYGIEYFLEKKPLQECSSIKECILKDMPLPIYSNYEDKGILEEEEQQYIYNKILDKNIDPNLKNDFDNRLKKLTNKISLSKLIILIIICILILYLGFFYFIKKSS